MAKKYDNDKFFLVIEMSIREAAFTCNFGYIIPNGIPVIIDDNTNEVIQGNVYYVAVLNRVFGKESYEDWYENATRYKEDIPYEEKHFNYYANSKVEERYEDTMNIVEKIFRDYIKDIIMVRFSNIPFILWME